MGIRSLPISPVGPHTPANDATSTTAHAHSLQRSQHGASGCPRCAVCHRVDGRGGQVGPELSAIAKGLDRTKLIESILTPSKEIAPTFTTWIITTRDGKTYTGVIVSENFDSTFTLADANGKRIVLKRLDVEDRQASPKSLMPDDLHRQMTRREFLDLLAYFVSLQAP